jgi:hypothetical protein
VKRAISTLSLAVIVVSGILFTTGAPLSPALAATPQPSAPASTSKDACAAVKSKWAHVQCLQFNNSAPGDEYFGRMKMSYLGIDNTYKDGAISAGPTYSTDPKLISKLDFATEALHKWAQKYPNDPQLARTYYLGVLVLRKVYTQPEQQTTWEFMQILVHKYPNTYFGKSVKSQIAGGFTEHWFAVAQICPTPLPRGLKPTAVALETPAPTPSPGPGHPAVEVITPPCVQPTPAPEETTGPSPSTSPSAR